MAPDLPPPARRPVVGAGPVVLSFTALPEHVRTARLVAATVARRAGLDDDVVEEVRLAVGEACGRAVQRAEGSGSAAPVEVRVTTTAAELAVDVVDPAGDDGVESEEVALLLMQGLADRVHVGPGPGGPGGAAQLVWRLGARGAAAEQVPPPA